ncbi:hypothetical protein KI387_036652, partial [Taxus chinensis]
MEEHDGLEKKPTDILGSMAMTPLGPSQTKVEKEDEIFEEHAFQELGESAVMSYEEEELASWKRKGKSPL